MRFKRSSVVVFLPFASASLVQAADIGTAFTYQGYLEKPAGTPVNALGANACDFYVQSFAVPTGGTNLGGDVVSGVEVKNGLFTVQFDLANPGNVFTGQGRWLEISIDCPGLGGSTLSPRVELTPAPHALALPGLYTQQNPTSPNLIGGYSGNNVSAGAVGATIGGGGLSGFTNRVTAHYGTIGGGFGNTASGASATVAGGAYNVASGVGSTVPGGTENVAGGDYSFAAGWGVVRDAATSLDADGDEGTFIWADNLGGPLSSTGPNQFLIRAAGGVGINTNNPKTPLHVEGGSDASLSDGSGYLLIGDPNGVNVLMDNNEIMARNDGAAWDLTLNNDGGRVGVGLNPSTYAFEVEGDAGKTVGGSDWVVISDRRIKTNIEDVHGALETLAKLHPVSFEYTDDYKAGHPEAGNRREFNVIAQEYAEVFPDYVKPMKGMLPDGGDALSVDLHPLKVYSVAAIQELHGVVRDQEARIAALEGRLEALERANGGSVVRAGLPLALLGLVVVVALRRRSNGESR